MRRGSDGDKPSTMLAHAMTVGRRQSTSYASCNLGGKWSLLEASPDQGRRRAIKIDGKRRVAVRA